MIFAIIFVTMNGHLNYSKHNFLIFKPRAMGREILILYHLNGLKVRYFINSTLLYFTIKECEIDLSNNILFDQSDQDACRRFKRAKCS